MIFDRKQRLSVRRIILHNFQKKKSQNFFFILEIFVFQEFRPKNSAPETQTYKLDPLKIKNNFKKLRTMTQNQFIFRPAPMRMY